MYGQGRFGPMSGRGGQYGAYGRSPYGFRRYGQSSYGGYGDRWRRMYMNLMRRYRRGRQRWRHRYARREQNRERRMKTRLKQMYGPRKPQGKCGKHCFKHVPIRML